MPRALVVDDHDDARYLLDTLLRAHGYEVVATANGAEALAAARRLAPDVIVSDILMPVMDGFALCRECRRDPALSRLPFVFYTATYTDEKDEALALSLGADLFLVKPCEPDLLVESITAALARGHAPTPGNGTAPPASEEGTLEQYNQALVRKLESKLAQLEDAGRALALRGAVIESSVSGVALGDLEGRCTYVNPSLCRMWGRPAGDLVGRRLTALLPDDSAIRSMAAALDASRSWVGTVRVRREDGTLLVLQALVEKVASPEGPPLCLMLSCVDVTELVRVQEELQQARRLESLSLFSRSLAHDFNNLLMGMLSNVEMGIRSLPPDSPATKYLNVAVEAADRVRGFTERMRSFARGRAAPRVAVDVKSALESCAHWALAGSPVGLETVAGADAWPARADPHALDQVFGNLLINAREAMPSGGTVRARIENRERRGEDRAVEITLRDEGPGIPRALARRVFDPFYTTKENGTGLGLATCYWILKDHGGGIALDTAVDGPGASFVLQLPAFVEEPASP